MPTLAPARSRRGGRPRLDSEERRAHRVVVLVSRSESEALLAAARGARCSVSALLRDCVQRRRPRPVVPEVNYQAVAALNRIGNNLNQLVALAHAQHLPLDLLPVLRQLLALLPLSKAELIGTPPEAEEPEP